MRYKTRRKWRHFKFWIARKMFPNGELRFLDNPLILDISLKQISSSKAYATKEYEFINDKHIKEVLVTEMTQNLVNHLDYEVDNKGSITVCKGALTIAEREVV